MRKSSWRARTTVQSFFALTFAFAVVVVLATATDARASSPFGISARPLRVIFEPGAPETATRVRIEGLIALGMEAADFGPPTCGYLYFECKAGEETLCREQWQDVAAAAAAGRCAQFAPHRSSTGQILVAGRVRAFSEAPSSPDAYQPSLGLGVMTLDCGLPFAVDCAIPAGGAGGVGGAGVEGKGGQGGRGAGGAGGSAVGGGTAATGGAAGGSAGRSGVAGTSGSGGAPASASGGGPGMGGAPAGASGGATGGGSPPAGSGGTTSTVDAAIDGPPTKKGGGCAVVGTTPAGSLLGVAVGLFLVYASRSGRRRRPR